MKVLSLIGFAGMDVDIRTGTADLKSSQQYPKNFGQRVAELHLDYMRSEAWVIKIDLF